MEILGVSFLAAVMLAAVLLVGLPGRIARRRGHPSARAIGICSICGLAVLFIWFIALAYMLVATQRESVQAAIKGDAIGSLEAQIRLRQCVPDAVGATPILGGVLSRFCGLFFDTGAIRKQIKALEDLAKASDDAAKAAERGRIPAALARAELAGASEADRIRLRGELEAEARQAEIADLQEAIQQSDAELKRIERDVASREHHGVALTACAVCASLSPALWLVAFIWAYTNPQRPPAEQAAPAAREPDYHYGTPANAPRAQAVGPASMPTMKSRRERAAERGRGSPDR